MPDPSPRPAATRQPEARPELPTITPHQLPAVANPATADPETPDQLPAPADPELAAETVASWAPNTRRAYAAAWRRWTAWADAHGVAELPAQPADVRAYILDRAAAGRVDATLRMDVGGIAAVHQAQGIPSPCAARGLVARTLARLAKAPDRARAQRQADGLTTDALAAIRATACRPRARRRQERPDEAQRRGLVDIALAGLLSDAGLRRSEAAALTWADLERAPDGSGRLTVRRSKTDQTAEGRVVAVTAPTMRDVLAIRPADVDPAAPVFGLSADRIARRIKAAARAAGLGDGFSGHSGRVGMARRMVARGAPTAAVIRQGRWSERSGGAMVARYTRSEDAAAALPYLAD